MSIFHDYAPDDLDVKVSQLLVATTDHADRAIDDAVPEVLRLLRSRLQMDVVFVAEFVGDQHVLRHVAQDAGKGAFTEGGCSPLEDSWCKQVVDGRLPELIADTRYLKAKGLLPEAGIPIGTHISTPIVLANGQVYGTLCCLSFGVNESVNEAHLRNLQYTARLTAQKIDRGRDPGT